MKKSRAKAKTSAKASKKRTAARPAKRAAKRPASTTRRPNARRLNDITVKDAIVTLLKARKKPMHYRDIANILLKEGRYKTKSKNFLTTVAITILRDRRLKRVEPGVYSLRG